MKTPQDRFFLPGTLASEVWLSTLHTDASAVHSFMASTGESAPKTGVHLLKG